MEEYSYPYNNPPTEMEKNPAYVAMETDQSVRPQNTEGNVTEHDYAAVDREGDDTASALNDEHTQQSAYEPSYI